MSEIGRIGIIRTDAPVEKQRKCPLLSIAGQSYQSCITSDCAFWIQHDGYNGKWGHCGFIHPWHHGLQWKLDGDDA